MELAALEARIDELVNDLAHYSGHRTLWLDARGEVIHSEPEDMLEVHGYRYISTLFHPDREELTAAVLRVVPVELGAPLRLTTNPWTDAPATVTPAFAL